MASVSRTMAQQVVCSICQSSLLEQRNGQNQVVASSICGHVFHKTCMEESRVTSARRTSIGNQSHENSRRERSFDEPDRPRLTYFSCSTGNASCPKCGKLFPIHGKYIVELCLDSKDYAEYTKLESAKTALENEKATLTNDLRKLKEAKDAVETDRRGLLEKIKRLENEKWQLADDNERNMRVIIEQNEWTTEWNTQIETENENLVTKTRKLVEEIKLLREGQKKAVATEVSKVLDENRELSKRMITAEIKLTLLRNADLLEETYGDLKWSDLTDTFQEELLRKLQNGGISPLNFDEDLPINSKALLRLIKAGENDEKILQNIIEVYLEEKVHSNGKVSWDDLGNSFRQYFISTMRESSQVGSLQLSQVPLSSNIVARLIKDNAGHNPNMLGEIITSYLEDEVKNWSVHVVNDLLKVALLELINEQIIDEIQLVTPLNSESLVVPALLRLSQPKLVYEFEQDSVKYWVIGTMISKLMEEVKISRINAARLIHKGCMQADSLGIYFLDYMSDAAPSNVTNFDEVDDTLAGLLLILCVMKLPSLEALITVLKYFEKRNLLEVSFLHKSHYRVTLLHAAAVRGDLEVVKCLLYQFGFSKELTHPRFQNLMEACVENTKNCRAKQIQQREMIINELIKLNRNFAKWDWDISSGSLNEHKDLVKLVKGLQS